MQPGNHPSHQPSPQPAEQPPGLRDRISRLLRFGTSDVDQTALQPLFDQMTVANAHQADLIKQALGSRPEIAEILSQFLDPDMDLGNSFGLIRQLNEKYGPTTGKRQRKYYTASFNLPHGAKLHIKVFPDMDNAISFGLGGTM